MLGVIQIPAAGPGSTYEDIRTKCNEYAKQRAIEAAAAGKLSDLTSLQNDIDACTASMDRRRQVLQGILLTAGVATAGVLGFWLLKQR